MLCVVSLLASELAWGVATWYTRAFPPAARMQLFSGLMLLVSLALGAISLALAVAVLRHRKTPPPQGILVFAAVVSIAPFVAVAMLAVR